MQNRVYTALQANKKGKVITGGIIIEGQARPDALTSVVRQELLELVTRGAVTEGTPFRVAVSEPNGKKVGVWTFKAKPARGATAIVMKRSVPVSKPAPKKATKRA